MKIYFATWLQEASQADALTKHGVKNRLLSYYYLKPLYRINRLRRIQTLRGFYNLPKDELTEYVQEGTITDPLILKKKYNEKN